MRFSISSTRTLNAPRRRVFRIVTEFDRLHERFPALFRSVRVIESSPQDAITVETFSLMGTTMKQRTRHHMVDATTHTVEILTGDLAGTKIVERYSDGPGRATTVDLEGHVKLSGLASILPVAIVKPLLEANLQRIFDEVDRYLKRDSTA